MRFCSECHNMYYLKIRDDNDEVTDSLIYYCRNCGHEDTTASGESICVSDTQLSRSEQKYTHMVNQYTKYDPTLPRINTIKCPNQECSSNMSGKSGGATGTTVVVKKKTAATKKTAAKTVAIEKAIAEEEALEEQSASAATTAEQNEVIPGNSQREVIYIRYDDINMKYVYLCVHCDTTWKTDNR